MANIKCFYIEPTGRYNVSLRRYSSGSNDCIDGWIHNASIKIGETDINSASGDLHSHDDPKWPKFCTTCNQYEFKDFDEWQLNHHEIYIDRKTGSLYELGSSVPVGAIWRCTWYEDMKDFTGPDGKSYCVKTPGGDWVIDSRASNCTLPNDNIHKCWVRTGEPPNFTVGKNGNTCAAGAGSIMMKNYHGFLINGELTSC